MNRSIVLLFLFILLTVSLFAPTGLAQKPAVADKAVAVAVDNAPMELAKATLAAHGGDKLKHITSLVMKGSVDLNVMNQVMPGAFSTAFSGEKYYFEINSAVQSMKQVYDGHQTYSSIPGFSFPPITSLGFPLLPRVGDTGYAVTALADDKKKRKGFRITTPDGFYTDFFVDEKTGQIKGYESSYDVGGRIVTTSVEVDEFLTVDGIVVPNKYSQRIDLVGQMTAYASFKAKTILVNSTIEDDAFAIPKIPSFSLASAGQKSWNSTTISQSGSISTSRAFFSAPLRVQLILNSPNIRLPGGCRPASLLRRRCADFDSRQSRRGCRLFSLEHPAAH